MIISRKNFLCLGLLAIAIGSAQARTYQLKKVMIINETGQGGYVNTNCINFLSNYYNTYLGPKYGFKCTIPSNQAAIDAVFRDDSLSTYDVIVFTGGQRIGGTGAIGDTGAQHAFQRWLKHGGGLVGWGELMAHNNTWPWLRDTVFNGTIYTVHSNWGSDPNAKVQWDTLKTNGVLNSIKPEYDSIRACFPPLHNNFTYPGEWYSVSINPRPSADILLTIDEATYTVPSGGTMGLGHPVAWAYHLPPDSAGNVGRFIFNSRDHDVGSYDGTSSGHAPISPAPVNGIVYSDTSHDLMTKGFMWQSLRWAAGLTQSSVSIRQVAGDDHKGGLNLRNQQSVLRIAIDNLAGRAEVEVFDLFGHHLGHQSGMGSHEFSFPNLKRNSIYLVQIRTDGQNLTKRIVF